MCHGSGVMNRYKGGVHPIAYEGNRPPGITPSPGRFSVLLSKPRIGNSGTRPAYDVSQIMRTYGNLLDVGHATGWANGSPIRETGRAPGREREGQYLKIM